MNSCYLCTTKSVSELTQVCSSTTPRTNTLYADKIAELVGEDNVLIITPNDYMCKRCTKLLAHVDNLETDIKKIKNTLLTLILKKYGMLTPGQSLPMDFEVTNGNLETDDPDSGKTYAPSGLRLSGSSPVNSPLNQVKQRPTSSTQLTVGNSSSSSSSSSKIKIYKCGFCTFQSKELGHVRFHVRSHSKRKVGESSEKAEPVAKVVTPKPPAPKKLVFKCQICCESFNSKSECLDHIQRTHKRPSENKEERETNKIVTEDSNIKKQESQNFQGTQQAANSAMETDGPQAKVTGTSNYHNPAEGTAALEVQEKTQNSDERAAELAQVKSECGTAVLVVKSEPGQENPMNVNQDNFDHIVKSVDGLDNDGDPEHLDIEQLLADLHNDDPNAAQDEETQLN